MNSEIDNSWAYGYFDTWKTHLLVKKECSINHTVYWLLEINNPTFFKKCQIVLQGKMSFLAVGKRQLRIRLRPSAIAKDYNYLTSELDLLVIVIWRNGCCVGDRDCELTYAGTTIRGRYPVCTVYVFNCKEFSFR